MNTLLKCCVLILFFPLSISAQDGIKISNTHPQYWNYKGEEILLLGGSIEDNLFQIQGLESHLDLLKSVGGNYVRNTMSSRDSGNVWAFFYDDEKEAYDLNRWNAEYWDRFERFLKLSSERDIIAQIEIWATFDFYRDNWDVNPYNPKNNLNYTVERTNLPVEVKTHPTRTDNPFFWSVPMQHNNIPLLTYQQRFVDKILSYTLDYGNILYCIDNETSVTASWGKFWSDYIRKVAQEQGKKIFITEMWDPWDLGHITHRETFDHPETYDFVEISQNNHQKGQAHWDNGLAQIERLYKNGKLRPVNNIKTYGNDIGRHGHGTENGIQSLIRSTFFGSAAIRFHRPGSGLGLGEEAQTVIKSLRELSERMPFFESEPNNSLLQEREDNEAYCRALVGRCYAVYFTNGGEVILNLEEVEGKAKLSWLNVMDSRWKETKAIDGGEKIKLTAPTADDWIALINFE